MTSPLDVRRHRSAKALLTAIEARLRVSAQGDPRRLGLLRVQYAIGRLLARLEMSHPGEWVVKGGSSLLARFDGDCRLSRDLDLQQRHLREAGLGAIISAASTRTDDLLEFHVDRSARLRPEEVVGIKVRVTAWLAWRLFATFDLDVVQEQSAIGRVTRRRPYLPLALEGVPEPEVTLYPVEDHVADKLSAMGKVHRHGGRTVYSTRYRDLADLALIASSLPVEAAALSAALDVPSRHWARDAFGETGLRPPGPDWAQRYASTMRAEPVVVARWPTMAAALTEAKPMADPALAGEAKGVWDPAAACWADR